MFEIGAAGGKSGMNRIAIVLAFGAFALLAAIGTEADAQAARKFYSFTGGLGGEEPVAGLIADRAGNLYGSVEVGSPCGEFTCSIVYKLSKTGQFTTLHDFTGGNDGDNVRGRLVADGDGNLYGTTSGGGFGCGCGTVFKITPGGTETILFSFPGGQDGYDPFAGLTFGPDGNLYGTTFYGGQGSVDGTVFRLTLDGGYTVLHKFTGGSDGANPESTPVFDSQGNLYVTTNAGGGACGCGTIFMIAPGGATSTVHAFAGGKDGAYPSSGLVLGRYHILYGVTFRGGGGKGDDCGDIGCGTVYRLANGKEAVLYAFQGKKDGGLPEASPTFAADGNIYGTTAVGGNLHCGGGCGTVYRVGVDGKETVLYAFRPTHSDGYTPESEPYINKRGDLYGAAAGGGLYNYGEVFQLIGVVGR
jgi:uncharacterized repeat protein (TIGR03803 family)